MVATAVAMLATSSAALSPQDRCELVKTKLAGKYTSCRLKAEARAIKRGDVPNFAKCDDRLTSKWVKAEDRAIATGEPCADNLSAAEVQAFVIEETSTITQAIGGGALPGPRVTMLATGQDMAYGAGSDGDLLVGAALSYTDNGDGTITDNNTGLMWEKKDDSGGIHDKDNWYTWCGPSCGTTNIMDGTIVTAFLDVLNDAGGNGAHCFAGYCDWRAPNIRELLSIIDYGSEVDGRPINAVFHRTATCAGCSDVTLPECSCTADLDNWSSSVWAVDFNQLTNYWDPPKTIALPVRAVRGGG